MRPGYLDLSGNKISINAISVQTIHKAKENDLDWLGDMEQVIARIFTDPVSLGKAIAFCSERPIDGILEGLSGDVIEKARNAFVQAYAEFLPSKLREEFLKIPDEFDKAIDEALTAAGLGDDGNSSEGANNGQ